MLTSRGFTLLASSVNTWVVYQLLMSGDFHSIIRKCIYSNPNYGPCWFKVKTCPVFTAGEVILQSLRAVAWELSSHNDLYLNAIDSLPAVKRERIKLVIVTSLMLFNRIAILPTIESCRL